MTRVISVAGFMTLALFVSCGVTLAQQQTREQDRPPNVAADKFPPWPQNRLRSFYADQARRYLRLDEPLPDVLPEFPGLDGGTFGHWGQAASKYLMDDSFNRVDYGGMLSTATSHFGSKTTKAIIVQPGTHGSLSALFDPTRMSFTDVWDGPLVSFSPYMFGLVSPAEPRGRQWLNLQGSRWNITKTTEQQYVGLFRHGRTIYTVPVTVPPSIRRATLAATATMRSRFARCTSCRMVARCLWRFPSCIP